MNTPEGKFGDLVTLHDHAIDSALDDDGELSIETENRSALFMTVLADALGLPPDYRLEQLTLMSSIQSATESQAETDPATEAESSEYYLEFQQLPPDSSVQSISYDAWLKSIPRKESKD